MPTVTEEMEGSSMEPETVMFSEPAATVKFAVGAVMVTDGAVVSWERLKLEVSV